MPASHNVLGLRPSSAGDATTGEAGFDSEYERFQERPGTPRGVRSLSSHPNLKVGSTVSQEQRREEQRRRRAPEQEEERRRERGVEEEQGGACGQAAAEAGAADEQLARPTAAGAVSRLQEGLNQKWEKQRGGSWRGADVERFFCMRERKKGAQGALAEEGEADEATPLASLLLAQVGEEWPRQERRRLEAWLQRKEVGEEIRQGAGFAVEAQEERRHEEREQEAEQHDARLPGEQLPAEEAAPEGEDAGGERPDGRERDPGPRRFFRKVWRRCGCTTCGNTALLPQLQGCSIAERHYSVQAEQVWASISIKGREHLGRHTGRAAAIQWLWEDGQEKPATLREAFKLFTLLDKEVVNASLRARTERGRKFRAKHAGPARRPNEHNYKKTRAPRPMPVTRLPKKDGSFTANEAEKHAVTKEDWMRIFWHHKPEDLPSLAAYLEECGDLFEEVPVDLPEISGLRLKRRALKKARGAQSLDGWAAEEIAALPLVIFNEYARLFEAIERGGEWPEALVHAPVPLLPKVGMSAAAEGSLKQRPVTVFAVLYRLYSSIRYKDLERWQEKWLSPELTGGRMGGETRDLSLALGLDVERALLLNRPLHGAALDEDKCFDSQVREIIFGLMRLVGGSRSNERLEGFIRSQERFYAKLRRCFRYGRSLGEFWGSQTSIGQGCALSMIYINLTVEGWRRYLRRKVPELRPRAFVDDRSMRHEQA